MGDFPAYDGWSIYSVQKTLPYLGRLGSVLGAHNYLALVDANGDIVREMHGIYKNDFTVNGPIPGNYLQVDTYERERYMGGQSILSAKLVFHGSKEDMRNLFETGFEAVAQALDSTHMLYDGARFFGHAVNSNSVWNTALRAMGKKETSKFDGPGSTPGNSVDLLSEPSNNRWKDTQDDPWTPNPAFWDGKLSSSDPSPPSEETDIALQEENGRLRQLLREMETLLDRIDTDDLPFDRDEISTALDMLVSDLDGLSSYADSDLLDRMQTIANQVSGWLDQAYDRIAAYNDAEREDIAFATEDWIEEQEDAPPQSVACQDEEPDSDQAFS